MWTSGIRVLLAAAAAWFVAQSIKIVIELVRYKRFNLLLFFATGKMPSSHTAFATALTTAIFRMEGPTVGFAIAFCLTMIVMVDASGVRRAVGQHSKIINHMLEHWDEITPEAYNRKIKEILGHTPLEVLCGGIIGLLAGWFCIF